MDEKMSVMIINEETFQRIGKFMSLRNKNIKAVYKKLESWHELNLKNYCKRYERHGEVFEGLEFEAKNFKFDYIPIPSAVQVMSDLNGLYYNCCDYGNEINMEAMNELEAEIKKVSTLKEYELTKQFSDDVAFY